MSRFSWLLRLLMPKKKAKPVGRKRTCDALAKAQKVDPRGEKKVNTWLTCSCLNEKDLPGKISQSGDLIGRSIEFHDIDGKRLPQADIGRLFWADKPEDPDPKYDHPPNEQPHLYFPKNGPNHYRKWATDPKTRKIFVEGAAKAACANKFGFQSVGIEGCWGWRSKKHGMLLLPEFNDFNFKDCDVYWIPDHDAKQKSVRDVMLASNTFLPLLKERGARVHLVWLPLIDGYTKVGVDDFLFHHSDGGKNRRAGKEALEQLLAEAQEWPEFELSDPGNAARWVELYGADFRYRGPKGPWYAYDHGLWQPDTTLRQQQSVKDMFSDLLAESKNMLNKELTKMLRSHTTAHRVASVGDLAKSDPKVVITQDHLDQHPLFVNCRNGTLELPNDKNGKLLFRPHDPKDLLTRSVSVLYDPNAKCPVFLESLKFWTKNDAALQRTIQQFLGLSTTDITREQVFVIMYGPGATGKSTLIELVHEVLGNYATTLAGDALLIRRHGQPEERKVMPLLGARFASASETEKTGVADENLIRRLTGEDTVAARALYHEQFTFIPKAKIWLRTNNRPEIRGGDETWRRIVAVPFGQVVPPEKKDKRLKEKLRTELPGIFAWMVEGYLDYACNGLVLAPVITQATAEYRKEQDIIQGFFDDRCEFGTKDAKDGKYEYFVEREKFYLTFVRWCEEQHKVPMNNAQFKDELKKRFEDQLVEKQIRILKTPGSTEKKQVWAWVGVRVRLQARY